MTTMDMKDSIISFIGDPYSRSHRQLPECVPSRRRARGPCRNLEPAAPVQVRIYVKI